MASQNITIDFVKEFQNDFINWLELCCNKYLTENLIREFQDRIHWGLIALTTKLSEGFIKDFKSKLNIKHVILFQKHLSPELLEELKIRPYLPALTDENCCVCLDCPLDMVKTNVCNHICCKICLDRILDSENSKCPLCRAELY